MNGLETETTGKIAFDRRSAVSTEGKAVMRAFSLRGHPSFALVTSEGELLWSYAGFIFEEDLREQLMQTTSEAQD